MRLPSTPRRRTLTFLGCALALIALFRPGCGEPTQPIDTANFTPEQLFRLHCSECHGRGRGDGHRATALKAKPKDMTDTAWQARVSDDHLYRVISEGGAAVKLHPDMPAWGLRLSRRQIEDLVQYIRTLNDGPQAGASGVTSKPVSSAPD